jgi:hypothetical protein
LLRRRLRRASARYFGSYGIRAGDPDVEVRDPVKAAGLEEEQRFALTPRLDYDRAAKTLLGAALEVRRLGIINALSLDAQGSADSAAAQLAATGSWQVNGERLRQVGWNAGYEYVDAPARGRRLRKSLGTVQMSMLGTEFGDSGMLWRGGAAFERGSQDSAFAQDELPVGTLVRSDYTGLKTFAGLMWRSQRQTLSASYGLQLGASGDDFSDGFRKHVLDVSYQLRWLPRDFMPQDLDLRLSAGTIEDRGGLPVSERFFGGSAPTPFAAMNDWQINASPLIRSFAQNELAPAGALAAGGERFASFNLTYAPTLWKIPLIPEELRDNSEVSGPVEAQLNSAETTLAAYYNGRDPAMNEIRGMSREQEHLREALSRYLVVLQGAEDADHGELDQAFFECLDSASSTLDNALPTMSDANLGKAAIEINAVLRKDGRIDQFATCASDLQGLLGPGINAALNDVQAAAAPLRAVYARFDPTRATHLAKSDLVFARRVVHRLFHEINLASVAPVLMLDAARLAPSVPGQSAWRYGIGAGVRVSLVDSVRFTLGYSVNPDPRPGERSGALTFSLAVVDLFH